MLRVRPIVFTPNLDAFTDTFTALGLRQVEDAPGWRVFAGDSGHVALHAADQPSLSFSFEVGSVTEFARRTAEAGTAAVVVDTADGPAAQVTTPDGRTFLAYEAPLADAAPVKEGLAVMPIWYTTDPAAGAKVFSDIGARQRISSRTGSWIDFAAKNGGLVAVHEAETDGTQLAFEFTGDITALQQRTPAATILIDENYGRSLRVPNPDGGRIWINEWQEDLYGYTRDTGS
ncbi:MAG: VOC family protein [Actinomycetes bacterium]